MLYKANVFFFLLLTQFYEAATSDFVKKSSSY